MLSENIKETVRFPKMLNVKLYIYYQEKHNNKVTSGEKYKKKKI